MRGYWEFEDHFFGARTYSSTAASNVGHGYLIADTSESGTPTYAAVDGSASGEIAVDLASTSEVENVCLYQGDTLQYSIDRIVEFEALVKLNQSSLDATSQFAIGLTGDRNDAIDSIAQAALFRVVGSDDVNAIVVETDDGTTDNDDVATGVSLTDSYAHLLISFALGKNDVRFFINGRPVAADVTFDMSAYSGSLQLFAQIQKTSDDNTDGFTLDYWRVRGRESIVAAA